MLLLAVTPSGSESDQDERDDCENQVIRNCLEMTVRMRELHHSESDNHSEGSDNRSEASEHSDHEDNDPQM